MSMSYPIYKGVKKEPANGDQLVKVKRRYPRLFAPHADDGRTQQSMADACDVNSIIRTYDRTGQLPASGRQPSYADVTAFNDDLTVLFSKSDQTIATANSFFESRSAESQNSKEVSKKEDNVKSDDSSSKDEDKSQ
jgi:hypothetical protein